MKNIIFTLCILISLSFKLSGQQLYTDFDSVKVISFGATTGTLDSMSVNPVPSVVDSSTYCAKYIRGTSLYDNIKMYPDTTLQNVLPYATNVPLAPKISMKLYSTAPVGTLVQIQLGSKNDDTYPSGIHSEYQAFTSAQNAWQDLIFDYYQSPSGSTVLPTQVNKIVILFNPSFMGYETMFFDDLKGPELLTAVSAITEPEITVPLKLYQNNPNPAKGTTKISFQIGSAGHVSLRLYDILGNPVSSLVDEPLKTGTYSIPVDTESIPNGIYFYVLKKGNDSRSMKMIISK